VQFLEVQLLAVALLDVEAAAFLVGPADLTATGLEGQLGTGVHHLLDLTLAAVAHLAHYLHHGLQLPHPADRPSHSDQLTDQAGIEVSHFNDRGRVGHRGGDDVHLLGAQKQLGDVFFVPDLLQPLEGAEVLVG